MKELSFNLFLCHSLQAGTVWLGIVWLKPLGIIGCSRYSTASSQWTADSLGPAAGTGSSSRWAVRFSHREWLCQIKHPINRGSGCQSRKNTLSAHRKRPEYAALLMNWNPKHTNLEHHTSTPGWDMELCWFRLGVYSEATEAQAGLANYYKFKRALGAAFICTIIQKKVPF